MRLLALAAAALASSILSPAPAAACSCAEPAPPCEAVWQTEVIFTGAVTAIASGAHQEQLATFAVDQTFRGTPGKTVVVRGGGLCGSTFEPGKKYLVYAGGGAQLTSSLCSRTKLLAQAKDDLAYLKDLPKRTKAVVDGAVRIEADGDGESPPRAGVVIKARGTAFATRTTAKGAYRLELPVGQYTLDLDDPALRILHGESPTVDLPNPGACAKRDVLAVWNGRIRGTLVDHKGAPAANIAVSAHAMGTTRQTWRLDAKTDATGAYEIAQVPPGTWIVAVGEPSTGGPDATQPIPTTYYPGTPLVGKAKLVATQRAGLVDTIDFKLPAPLAVHTITGFVKNANGIPLTGVSVKLANDTWPRATSVTSDVEGRYTFKEVAGADLILTVCAEAVNPQTYQPRCTETKLRVRRDQQLDLVKPR